MKFDTLCNIILEGKKSQQFARIVVANEAPVFSLEDVLRDPNDPSKGVRTYLDEKPKEVEGEEAQDSERPARRALRRLNWVAKTAIKRVGRRELSLNKLHFNIMTIIEQYLTNVMRYSEEQIGNMQLKIAKEAAFIGNLLLPPTNRYPNAKSAFNIAPEFKYEGEPTTKKEKKGLQGTGATGERLSKEFNMTVDEFIAAFDPDLLGTIKEIIRTGAIRKVKPEPTEEISEVGENEEAYEELAQESVEGDGEGVTVEDILKDPRVKNVYDARIVRKVIKSMLSLGTVIVNADGKLALPEPGTASWRAGFEKWKEEKDLQKIEDFPSEQDIKELGDEEPNIDDLNKIEAEDEEEEKEEVSTEDDTAASRLGYRSKSKTFKPEDEETPEEETPEEDESWYK